MAIFVYAFRGQHVEHLKPFIGSLILVYGIDGVGYEILAHKKRFLHASKTYLGIVDIVFGVVLMVAPIQFEYVCIIWATWSILRESYELKEIICDMKMVLPKILSAAEAIAVFVFSIILIIKPGEQHSLSHMDLLTVELIAGPLILLIDESLQYRKKKKAE